MQQEINIGRATYELHRVFSGTVKISDLILEKLESDVSDVDTRERRAV